MTPGTNYLVRVSWSFDGSASSVSASPVEIDAAGNRTFYVNDDDTNDDVYCTAIGDDANDGLAPSTPKATLQSVLDNYSLRGGDTVKIDTGTYPLSGTIIVTTNHFGLPGNPIRIVGSTNSSGSVLARNDTSNDALYLLGCQYIHFENLKVTGAQYGIHVESAMPPTPVDGIEVVGCEFYGDSYGLYLSHGTDAVVQNDLAHDNGGAGLYLNGSGAFIGNTCHNNGAGIIANVSADALTVEGNTCYGNGDGISVSESGGSLMVESNISYSNNNGISVSGSAGSLIVEGNTCYQNSGVGLDLYGSWDGSAVVIGNRIYLNGLGIQLSGANASRNIVYSNTGDGIYVLGGGTSSLQNNLVYANGGCNVHIYGGWPYGVASVLLQNNTLYGGNGLFVDNGNVYNGSPGAVTVSNRNNIIWADGAAARSSSRSARRPVAPPPSTATSMTCMPPAAPWSATGWAIKRDWPTGSTSRDWTARASPPTPAS